MRFAADESISESTEYICTSGHVIYTYTGESRPTVHATEYDEYEIGWYDNKVDGYVGSYECSNVQMFLSDVSWTC